jgi:hypothetical protein
MLGWKLHIGEVPDFDTLRERFLFAAECFNTKLLSKDTPLVLSVDPPYLPPGARPPPKQAAAPPGNTGRGGGGPLDDLKVSLLEAAAGPEPGNTGGGALRNESLRFFSQTWNAIIGDLRVADLISDKERALLAFSTWVDGAAGTAAGGAGPRGGGSVGGNFSRCAYLPPFVTAGKLNEVRTSRGRVGGGELGGKD